MRKILHLLGYLSDADIDWLIVRGTTQTIPRGTTLIQKGQPINALYILLDGILEVSGVTSDQRPIRLGSGEVVGEISLLDSRPPTATVSAATNAVVLAILRQDLQAKLDADAEFAARFYRSLAVFLADRLRGTYQRLGFDKSQPLDENVEYQDELSPELLDTVHVARARFDRALQRLLKR